MHIAVFPQKVKLKKRFVRLSGEIVPAKSGTVPDQLTVRAEVENPNTGKVTQSLSVKLDIQEDGRFEGSGRINKNLGAMEMMSITLEPSGDKLAKGTQITLRSPALYRLRPRDGLRLLRRRPEGPALPAVPGAAAEGARDKRGAAG